MTEPRPWRRALAWLAFLGPFFFASYGFANWLASRRNDVGAVAFGWERAIPFVPWTIVPYWSIDLLYVVSIVVCTTRRELDRHARINSRLWTRRHPRPAEVSDGVWIGRIPSAMELRALPFAAIVDLSAELSCGAHGERLYRGFPVLDLTVPDAAVLRAAAEAIDEARRRGPVLVCCALGYSRSAAAIVAWLLMTKRSATVEAAMAIVQKARPAIVLKREHCTALEAFA